MTEDEHKQLWCPHVRHIVVDIHGDVSGDRCIGSACAMWRWAEKPKLQFITPRSEPERDYFDRIKDTDPEPDRPDYVPVSYVWTPCHNDPAGWVEPEHEAQKRRPGYCGLAGKP